MRRIAYICADPGVPIFGHKGCSVHVQEVIRAFRAAGAEVELFAMRLGGDTPPDWGEAPVRCLPKVARAELAERELSCLAANDIWDSLLPPRFDMVYERYSLWSYAGMLRARKLGIPGLLEVNAPLIEEQMAHRGLVHEAKAREAASLAFQNASALLAVSDEVADYLGSWPNVGPKVHVVPNGVNPERFHFKADPAKRPAARPFTVGFVGTLKPWHGVTTLVAAFQSADARARMHLLIVGDGPERSRLEEQVAAAGVSERVEFTGAVAPEAIPDLLDRMDLAVAPYPDLPNFYFSPLKLFEYMAAGLPVIASRIGQIPGLIRHGQNGWLVAPGNAGELASALATLAQDGQLRKRLGAAARRTVLAEHTWGSVVERIVAIARTVRSSSAELKIGVPV